MFIADGWGGALVCVRHYATESSLMWGAKLCIGWQTGPQTVPMSDVFGPRAALGVPFTDVLLYRIIEGKIRFHDKLSRSEMCPVKRRASTL